MKYLIFVLLLVSSTALSQTDTTLTRLQNELSKSSNRDEKIAVLKKIIDHAVIYDSATAEKSINEAIFLAEESRDRKLMAGIRIHIARAYLLQAGKQSYINKAEIYINQALKICKESDGLERELIMAQLTLSRIHRNSGRGEKAIEANTTAINYANDLGDDSLRVWAYMANGRNYQFRDEKLNAFKNYLAALNIADQTKHKDKEILLVNCYRSLSDFFATIGNHDKAIDYYTKVLEFDLSKGKMTELTADYNAMGALYQYQKKYDIASTYFEKSFKLADSLKNQQGKIQSTFSLVNNLFAKGQMKEGLAYLETHPELSNMLQQMQLGYIMDRAKALIYLDLKNYDSTNYYYSKLFPVYERENNVYTKAQFYIEYGYTLRKMGRAKEAIPFLLKGKGFCEQSNNLEGVKMALSYLDSCYTEIGDYKNALTYSSQFNILKDSLEVLGKEKDLVSMEIDAENKRKERKQKEEEEALQTRHNIQYTGITIGILVLFLLLVSFGFLKVPIGWIRALGFISFIFFFEFIILIADNQIHHFTHGEPWKVLAIKVVLIAILLPLHHLVEKKVVHMITAHRIKQNVI